MRFPAILMKYTLVLHRLNIVLLMVQRHHIGS